jgi:hypothetical protein
MMRKRNNMKHRGGGERSGGGGGRRYHNSGDRTGGQNRSGSDANSLSRQKHHATQMREKYMNMARDAQSNGERVDVEYYLQHVDHYVRVLAGIAVIEAERFAQYREQNPAVANPPAASGEGFIDAQAAAPYAPSQQPQDSSEGSQSEVGMANQPRMTRQPRREYAAPPGNAPAQEIPLPGSILTEIQP